MAAVRPDWTEAVEAIGHEGPELAVIAGVLDRLEDPGDQLPRPRRCSAALRAERVVLRSGCSSALALIQMRVSWPALPPKNVPVWRICRALPAASTTSAEKFSTTEIFVRLDFSIRFSTRPSGVSAPASAGGNLTAPSSMTLATAISTQFEWANRSWIVWLDVADGVEGDRPVGSAAERPSLKITSRICSLM